MLFMFIKPDLPHTHDGPVHLARMAAYYKALKDGHIMPRWAGDLNYGYGMPLFNFMYHTPYMVSSIFLSFGFGLVTAYKLILAISYVLSGIFMYLFAKEYFKNSQKAVLATALYQFAPFRFVELLVRGSAGEVYTYTFLPLVLLGIVKLYRRLSLFPFIIIAIGSALLIISHNSLSFVFFLICFFFALISAKNLRERMWGMAGLLYGICIASFYWIPAIAEHAYTYGNLFMKDMFRSHFPPLVNFFIPNFTNSASLQTEGIAVHIGLPHTLVIVGAIFAFISKKLNKQEQVVFLYSFILLAVSFFFMQPISTFVWEKISLLRQFQFPWRLIAITVFATSILSSSIFSFKFMKKKVVFYILLFIILFSPSYYLKVPLFDKETNENYYWNYPMNTTYFGETDVIWSAGPASQYPKKRIEVIEGNAVVYNVTRKTTRYEFDVFANTTARLVSNTQYFPGWRVYVDKVKVPIEFQDMNSRGLITFKVEKGQHHVRIFFGESKIRLIADILSIVSLSSLFILYILYKLRIIR